MKFFTRTALALALAHAATLAWAQFPEKPVTLVVPFAAGGPSDKIARDLAEALRKPLGQTVIVDNSGGAGGTIGAAKVAKASPDGYTLLVHHIGMSTAPALYRKLSYKVLDDFEFLGLVNEAPSVLIGKPGLPAGNFEELRKWIAANSGKVNLANAGLGSASHLCGLMFQNALKTNLTTVPYKGTAPAMTDLIGGQVDLMCEQATNAVPQIEGKKVKVKDFNVQVWHGLYAPRGTPPAVLAKLNAALRTALKDPDLVKRQEALGLSVITDARLDPAGHKKFVEAEMTRGSKVIKDAGEYAD
jgi:tripartite-type tricarboxylate transporter receptor subunit TctC